MKMLGVARKRATRAVRHAPQWIAHRITRRAYFPAPPPHRPFPETLAAAIHDAEFVAYCRGHLRRPLTSAELAVLFAFRAWRSQDCRAAADAIALLERLRLEGAVDDHAKALARDLFHAGELRVVDGLLVLSTLEEPGLEAEWARLAFRLLKKAEPGDLETVRKLLYVSRGSTRTWGHATPLPFFTDLTPLRKINALARRAAERLEPRVTAQPHIRSGIGAEARIAFVASRPFTSESNAHLNLLLNAARALRSASPNARLHLGITCDDHLWTPWGEWGRIDADVMRMHRQAWHDADPAPDCVYPAPEAAARMRRQDLAAGFLPWLEQVAPTVVIFIGGSYESIVARTECFARFPVILFPSSIKNPADRYADGIVATKPAYAEKLASRVEPERILRLPTPIRIFLDDRPYDGPPIRRSPADFVMVTVLGQHRLVGQFQKIDASGLDQLTALFDRNPELVWQLVGVEGFEHILACSEKLRVLHQHGRLRHLGYVAALRGLFRNADAVFVMPGMTGGNQAVIAAMHEGLPAIVPRISDSSSIVPEEGLFDDLAGSVRLIEKLIRDRHFAQQLVREGRTRLAEHAVDKVGGAWLAAIDAAHARGRQRLASRPHAVAGALRSRSTTLP